MIKNVRDTIGLAAIAMMFASPFAAFWNFGAAVLFLLVGLLVFSIAE